MPRSKLPENVVPLVLAAQRLRLSYQDAHRLVLLGRLRGQKIGGRWHISREDVEQLVRERQSELAADDGRTT